MTSSDLQEAHKLELRAAQQHQRQARRLLDEAIYADAANRDLVEQRARDLSAAQSEVVRVQALKELKIRRVLTPEQIEIFRNLRQQALAAQRAQQQQVQQQQQKQRQLRRQERATQPRSESSNEDSTRPRGRLKPRKRNVTNTNTRHLRNITQ